MSHKIEVVTIQISPQVIYDLLARVDELARTVLHLKNEKETPEKFTIKEAAKELGLSAHTVYMKVYEHEIKAHQNTRKGRIFIHRDEILKYNTRNNKASNI